MSYPFYIHQHPCRLFFAAAAVAAPFILFSNNAYAALNCTTQPTCQQLGYSKSVDANCDDYILCPFDTSYKRCITGKIDCSGYPLTKCPVNADCDECDDGTGTKFKITACNSKYADAIAPDGLKCMASCDTHYVSENRPALTYCPPLADCYTCTDGVKIYNVLDFCWDGYVERSDGKGCIINPCTGYDFTKCPTGFKCSECQQGDSPYAIPVYKYKPRNLITCGTGEAEYYMSDNYDFDPDGCPDDAVCGYCQDGNRTALYLKECLNGGYVSGTDPLECDRDCPSDMSDYYPKSKVPFNKEVIDSCKYYSGLEWSGDYTLYYKVGTSDCPSSANIDVDRCTFGGTGKCQKFTRYGLITYVSKCNGTDSETSYGCVDELDGNWIDSSILKSSVGSCSGSCCQYRSTSGALFYANKNHTCKYNGKTYYHDC